MIARGFAPAGRTAKDFPEAYFLPICTGVRTLRPACDLIIAAVAANDMHRLEDIEEAVVELVKDSCRKLNDTNNKGKMVVPNPAIPPGQVTARGPKSVGGCDDYREPWSTSSKSSARPRPRRRTAWTCSCGCGWSKRTCCTSQRPCCRTTATGSSACSWSQRRCCRTTRTGSPGCGWSKPTG